MSALPATRKAFEDALQRHRNQNIHWNATFMVKGQGDSHYRFDIRLIARYLS